MREWTPGMQQVLYGLAHQHVLGERHVPTKHVHANCIALSLDQVRDRLVKLEAMGVVRKGTRGRRNLWRIAPARLL